MRRSKRAGIYLLLGTPALCCVGGFAALFIGARSVHKELSGERLEAQRLGIPLTFKEIPSPVVPDSLNAAPLYLQAEKLLEGKLGPQSREVHGTDRRGNRVTIRADVNRDLDSMAPLFAVLDSLPGRPGCDFHRDREHVGPRLHPEWTAMRSCVYYLCQRADRDDRQDDVSGAMRSLRLAHRVSHDIGQDPTLIALIDQTFTRQTIDRECERLIGRHTRDRRFLEPMGALLRSESEMPDIRRAMAGELAMGLIDIHSLETLRWGRDVHPTQAERQFYQSPLVQESFEADYLRTWFIGWKSFPKDDRDWVGYGLAMKKMSKAIDEDLSPARAASQAFIPAFQFTDSIGVLQARDRLLETSVRLLQDRQRTGKLPVVLPADLGDARLDPFDGKPLRYRRKGSGFLLYSIGSDRTDDGGHLRMRGDARNRHYDEVVEFG